MLSSFRILSRIFENSDNLINKLSLNSCLSNLNFQSSHGSVCLSAWLQGGRIRSTPKSNYLSIRQKYTFRRCEILKNFHQEDSRPKIVNFSVYRKSDPEECLKVLPSEIWQLLAITNSILIRLPMAQRQFTVLKE